jgi:2-dehydro-3-deoxyglucarate aldolase/4-hydroxy-2-oxoheptanedioate aldolase
MTTHVFENRIKRLVKQGKKVAGAWSQIASPMSTEILARAGFDFLMIDLEHGPSDVLALVAQCQAMNGSNAVPFVRAPWNDSVAIKRILDAGAYGVLVPYVNTKQEAQAAVSACKYPPQGIRGVAGSPRAAGYGQNIMNYLKYANDEIFIMTAIETPEAVANLDEILTVDGLDGIFIGPMDLSTSMGYFGNPNNPEVQQVIAGIEKKVLTSGKALATISGSWQQAADLYKRGYRLVLLMADGVALGSMASERVVQFRKEFPEG